MISEESDTGNSSSRLDSSMTHKKNGPMTSRIGTAAECQRLSDW